MASFRLVYKPVMTQVLFAYFSCHFSILIVPSYNFFTNKKRWKIKIFVICRNVFFKVKTKQKIKLKSVNVLFDHSNWLIEYELISFFFNEVIATAVQFWDSQVYGLEVLKSTLDLGTAGILNSNKVFLSAPSHCFPQSMYVAWYYTSLLIYTI